MILFVLLMALILSPLLIALWYLFWAFWYVTHNPNDRNPKRR